MKNVTFSVEGLLLALLLLIGLYGAQTVLKTDKVSPGIASPRQEAPAMVLTDLESNDITELPN
ncbi:MAG: hypothetical protein R2795_17490 [Saprospiraceae bacterium]